MVADGVLKHHFEFSELYISQLRRGPSIIRDKFTIDSFICLFVFRYPIIEFESHFCTLPMSSPKSSTSKASGKRENKRERDGWGKEGVEGTKEQQIRSPEALRVCPITF